MVDRRTFLGVAGLGGGGLALGGGGLAFGVDGLAHGGAGLATAPPALDAAGPILDRARPIEAAPSPSGGLLREAIAGIPVDDTHCHPLTFDDATTTPDGFLERLSLSAFPMANYFPPGVYGRWREGTPAERAALDRDHGISDARSAVLAQAGETVFVRFMLKEMAAFLDCEPTLEAVIEARNARGSDYATYLGDLFRDAGIANAMLDMGYREGLDRAGVEAFEAAIAPTAPRRILRVDTILGGLLVGDLDFDEIETRMLAEIRDGLDGTGNLGAPSYGMKSYLLPRIGLLKPLWDRAAARRSWETFRDARRRGEAPAADQVDRDEYWALQRDALLYLHSLALEECLARDMPMQFHAGDGEAPRGILRNQDPFLMEEMVRFERVGVMRMPQVILIHAGYPLIGRQAWLTHLYPNCHFELSLATPLIHHGMLRMMLEVMEVVPLSKILFGSDAYHLPELYWLAARWGRRFLADALGVYVDAGILSTGEAIEGARMILHGNNRRLYHLTD